MSATMRAHQEWDAVEQCLIGRDPREMTQAELEALGHTKTPLLKLIRKNCIECAGGNAAEVRRCGMVACSFWALRMNHNPFVSEARKQASAERMRALNAKRPEDIDE